MILWKERDSKKIDQKIDDEKRESRRVISVIHNNSSGCTFRGLGW